MRKPVLAVSAAVLLVPLTPSLGAAVGLTAADTGLFGQVFANSQGINCNSAEDSSPRCNPTANAIAQLADGRQIYWSGLEGMDDLAGSSVVTGYGDRALNSEAAILDLTGKKPRFTKPKQPDSGINQNGNPDNEYLPGGLYNNDNKLNDGDLFCADLNFLADGRVITNGGTSYYQEPGIPGAPDVGLVELNGLKNTRIFDPRTNSWSEAGKMNWARWYPQMVTQPDGSILAFSGVTKMIKPFYPERPMDSAANERHVERFDPKTGQWTDLADSAKKSLPLFPRMHLLPDGRTLYNAAGQVASPMGYAYDQATWSFVSVLDPKTESWTDLGVNDVGGLPLGFRGSGASIMLTIKPGDTETKFLSMGGEPFAWPGGHFGTPFTAVTSIKNGADVMTSVKSGDLHSPRWLSDGVLLSTGQVWAVNGGDRDHLHTPGIDYANKTTEMWDPRTGTWTVTAAQAKPRSYHTTAIPLPDGRVLVGGHAPISTLYGPPTDAFKDNLGMAPGYADSSFQIFSPPNLFWGKRPVIKAVDPTVKTGRLLNVKVDRPGDISSIRLMRNASVTHLVDGDQRNVELEIVKRTAKGVQVRLPGSNLLPPGPYMLFAHTDSKRGEIPSVARQVFVDAKISAAQQSGLRKRAAELTQVELTAGVPEVPGAGDLGDASPLPGQGDLAAVTGSAARTAAGRTGGRRTVSLRRRVR
ncbi:MAG: galactose oxidase-like domain-containing protein [Sporichthyaceae bacterium]